MILQDTIKTINFNEIKETGKTLQLNVKNNNTIRRIEFEYCDSDCIYDKKGFTYCVKLNDMPFYLYPMRNTNYIQTYKSVKRMLNTLFKNVKSDIEVEFA